VNSLLAPIYLLPNKKPCFDFFHFLNMSGFITKIVETHMSTLTGSIGVALMSIGIVLLFFVEVSAAMMPFFSATGLRFWGFSASSLLSYGVVVLAVPT